MQFNLKKVAVRIQKIQGRVDRQLNCQTFAYFRTQQLFPVEIAYRFYKNGHQESRWGVFSEAFNDFKKPDFLFVRNYVRMVDALASGNTREAKQALEKILDRENGSKAIFDRVYQDIIIR